VSGPRDQHSEKRAVPGATISRKPYRKPDFQHEKAFEIMALACGKVSPTQAQCHFNRKNS
jgi:hypothetical protein